MIGIVIGTKRLQLFNALTVWLWRKWTFVNGPGYCLSPHEKQNPPFVVINKVCIIDELDDNEKKTNKLKILREKNK